MQLLDRYLYAVRKHLPKNRATDIIEELRANILAQSEDQEEQLGRPLNLDEEETLLRQHGHPMLVSARYLPQQHLIGPLVFPYYWYALKTAFPWVAGIYFLVNALRFITEPLSAGAVTGIVLQFFWVAALAAFWITAVFAAMEFATSRYLHNPHVLWSWSPRALPEPEPQMEQRQPKHPVLDIILQAIGIAYILAVPLHPYLLLGPGAFYLRAFAPAPVLRIAYFAIVGVMIAKLVLQCFLLANPSARRSLRVPLQLADKVSSAAIIGLILYLVPDRQFLLLRETVRNAPGYQELVRNLNNGLYLVFRIALVIAVASLLWEIAVMIFRERHSGRTAIAGE